MTEIYIHIDARMVDDFHTHRPMSEAMPSGKGGQPSSTGASPSPHCMGGVQPIDLNCAANIHHPSLLCTCGTQTP